MSHSIRPASGPLVALITGASSGIGEATARRLAAEPGIELILVARRSELLERLAGELPCPASSVAVDLTDDDAPRKVLEHVDSVHGGALHLLVNNAGAAWRGTFAEGGWENYRRNMSLNFDAALRLTEALLPRLRASAPSAIVNVSSTAGRLSRAGSGGYSASKFALVAWSDALYGEERPNGIHVGLVLPGFVRTEGFPADELRARAVTRWAVSEPEKVAEAIAETGIGGRAERFVPRPYGLAAALRTLAPWLLRRAGASRRASVLTTKTGADHARQTQPPEPPEHPEQTG